MRRDALFSLALELAHRGLDEDLIGFCVAEVNRRLCCPPLGARDVEHQVHGAVVRARAVRRASRSCISAPSRRWPPSPTRRQPSSRGRRGGHRRSTTRRSSSSARCSQGPRPSAEVKAEGRARGLSERTVERARRSSGSFPRSPGTPRAGKADGSLFGTRRQSFGATAGSFGATARSFGATARVLSRPPLRTLQKSVATKRSRQALTPVYMSGCLGVRLRLLV